MLVFFCISFPREKRENRKNIFFSFCVRTKNCFFSFSSRTKNRFFSFFLSLPGRETDFFNCFFSCPDAKMIFFFSFCLGPDVKSFFFSTRTRHDLCFFRFCDRPWKFCLFFLIWFFLWMCKQCFFVRISNVFSFFPDVNSFFCLCPDVQCFFWTWYSFFVLSSWMWNRTFLFFLFYCVVNFSLSFLEVLSSFRFLLCKRNVMNYPHSCWNPHNGHLHFP